MKARTSSAEWRAVVLDVDGTLYRQRPLRVRMAHELLTYAFLHPRRGIRTIKILRKFRAERERLRTVEIERIVLDRIQYEVVGNHSWSAKDVEKTVREWIFQRPLKYIKQYKRPGIDRFLNFCKKRGVPVGVFSDYPTPSKIKALALDSFVELHIVSTDAAVNAFKPSPRGLLAASRHWDIPAREMLYIGDRMDVDAEAASRAGCGFILVGRRSADALFAVNDFFNLATLLGWE